MLYVVFGELLPEAAGLWKSKFPALAAVLDQLGFQANQVQNAAVQGVIHHAFSTIPGVLWIVTASVLFFYQINKNSYQRIIEELAVRKGEAA